MIKYIFRYIFFWVPAILVSSFLDIRTIYGFVANWFFAFFMLFGWVSNTAMASLKYPRQVFSLLCFYIGLEVAFIISAYSTHYSSFLHRISRFFAGIFSFYPMRIMVEILSDRAGLPWELLIIAGISVSCALGCLVGQIFKPAEVVRAEF